MGSPEDVFPNPANLANPLNPPNFARAFLKACLAYYLSICSSSSSSKSLRRAAVYNHDT